MGIIGRHVKLLVAYGTFFSLMIYSAIFIGVPLLLFAWFLLYYTEEINKQDKLYWVVVPIIIIAVAYGLQYLLYDCFMMCL